MSRQQQERLNFNQKPETRNQKPETRNQKPETQFRGVEQDYQTIVDVAAKLPEKVIQEDEKLLMYNDVASMRL